MTTDALTDRPVFTLDELCKSCDLTSDSVITYIQEGLIEVCGDDVSCWRFSEIHTMQIKKATRLEQDLRLNPAGSVLVIELMAQIESLKTQLARFEGFADAGGE